MQRKASPRALRLAAEWEHDLFSIRAPGIVTYIALALCLLVPCWAAAAEQEVDLRILSPQERADWRRAEAAARESFRKIQAQLKKDKLRLAESADKLAVLVAKSGRIAEAEELHKLGIMLLEEELGHRSTLVGLALSNYADSLRTAGRLEQAERTYERAITVFKAPQEGGDFKSGVALAYLGLAELKRAAGQYAAAEKYLTQILDMRDELYALPYYPDESLVMLRQAEVILLQGQIERATQVFRRAIGIVAAATGAESEEVAFWSQSFGSVLLAKGKFLEAHAVLERSLEIREKIFGMDALSVGMTLCDLGDLFLAQRHYKKAEVAYLRAKQIYLNNSESGVDPTGILNSLAKVYEQTGQIDRYQKTKEELRAIQEGAPK